MFVHNPIDPSGHTLELPQETVCYTMQAPSKIPDPVQAIQESLVRPIGSDSLSAIAIKKLQSNPKAKAVIVISDNTRPVPYKGDGNILVPILEILLESGYDAQNLTVLVATGTHRPMTEEELEKIIDPWVYMHKIAIINHDCKNEANFTYLGKTKKGSEVRINSLYMNADLKILTGLVESHFMAGVSGGRKSLCPGLISEKGTFLFHGAELMGSPFSRDLNLEGNPVHEESLEFANMATVDFIVNVTLDHKFAITGVYSGDLEKAHLAAFEMVKTYATIPIQEEADIVITHAGFVGINHYQHAKAAFAAIGAMKKNGYLISIGNYTDKKDIIGNVTYKIVLGILTLCGAKDLIKVLYSKDWPFIPDQWQVQKWATVFEKIPLDHYIYYAPQVPETSFSLLPGISGTTFTDKRDYSSVVMAAIDHIKKELNKDEVTITWLCDGPYAIPFVPAKNSKM